MSYALASDVETELGRVASSAEETAQWEAWLDRVERSIERMFRRAGLVLADEVVLGDPTVQDVVDVEVAAVLRKIQNPQWGLTSVTRSIDDASVTTRSDGSDIGDPLELTDAERNMLLSGGTFTDAFSTQPTFEADYPASVASWLP